MAETKYNGWANYETWAVSLWLNNDQGVYDLIMEKAEYFKKNPEVVMIGTEKHESPIESSLSGFIKRFVEANNPLEKASMYMDLLGFSISQADFTEIAKGFLEE